MGKYVTVNEIVRLGICIIIVLCTMQYASAVDSTNTSKYLFYDDAETGPFSTKWRPIDLTRNDYSSTAAYTGVKSIRDNNTGSTSNVQSFIKESLWNLSTASSPFCVDAMYKYTAIATSNGQCPAALMFAKLGESGFLVFPNCYTTGALTGIVVLSAVSSWVEISPMVANNTWSYIKICTNDGWAAAGSTNVTVYNSTTSNVTLYNNIVPRVALSNLSLAWFDGTGSTPNIFYDNIRAWNVTAYGTQPPQDVIVSYVTSAMIYNRSDAVKTNSSLKELETWHLKVNYTIDAVTPTIGICNYTTTNISQVDWNNVTGLNKSLAASTDTVAITPANFDDGAYDDTIIFRGCIEGGIGGDLYLYINNVSQANYSRTLFPHCNSGTHEVIFNSKTFNNTISVGVIVSCPTCNAGQRMRITIQNNFYDILKWSRRFLSYGPDTMYYNSTNKAYQSADFHNFLEAGVYTLTVSCSNGSNSTNISQISTLYVGNTTIYPYLLEIYDTNGNHTFNNGTLIESSDLNITGSCQGNIFTTKQINLTYNNGTFIKSEVGTQLSVNGLLLNEDGNYNVSMWCLSDEGNSAKETKYFTVNDTVKPVITWTNPNIAGTTVVNQNTQASILLQAYDYNLFSLMVNCSIGFLHLYDYYSENVSSGYIYLNNLTANNTILGTVTCVATAKDWHTKKDISSELITVEQLDDTDGVDGGHVVSKDIIFNKGVIGDNPEVRISLETFDELDDLKVTQEKDRYTFEPIVGKVENLPQELVYRLRCDYGSYLYYRDDRVYDPERQKYGKQFSCGDWWIDFHIDGLSERSYSVTETEQGKEYRIRISLIDLQQRIKDGSSDLSLLSSSVGVKNTEVSTTYYTVTAASTGTTSGGASDLGMLWVGLILIWIAVLFCGFLFMSELLVIDGLYGIFIGIALFMSYSWVALVFVALNCLLMIIGFVRNN